jgi:short-subunit dehydrogenase
LCAGNPDVWEKVIALNVSAPMRLTNRLLPPMLEARQGTIINIVSTSGIHPSGPKAVYVASKHGFLGWCLSLEQVSHVYDCAHCK